MQLSPRGTGQPYSILCAESGSNEEWTVEGSVLRAV